MINDAFRIFEQIVIILIGFFSTYIIFYFMSRFERTLYRRKYVYVIAYLIYTGALFVAQIFGGFTLNIIVTIFGTILVGHFLYNNKKIYIFYYSLYIVAILCFNIAALPMLEAIYRLVNVDFYNVVTLNIASSVVVQFINLSATKLFIIFYGRKNIQKISRFQYFNFLVLPLFSIFYVITLLMYMQIYISIEDLILLTVNIASIIVLNVFITNVFESVSRNNELKSELLLYEQQTKMQYDYYNSLEKKYKNSRKLIHDVKNHLQTIEELYRQQDSEKAKQYAKDMDKMFDKFAQRSYTSNKVLNIILNDKIQKAEELHIFFDCKIGNADMNFIKDIDLTSIFANLIDNAIEGARKANKQKYVLLKMDKFNGSFVINIENSIDKTPATIGHKFQSSKKNHEAIGIGNVKRTLEKYEGDVRIHFSDKVFKVNIVIPEA
ncbi:sensor histidine kinase [Clostridium oryzae]|uniref:Sensor histidine kinase NatK-like C-terminal domain-containing protein n=1 Tax=Clostridium oryzae TaxID=1450648 RepID=A0A1V4ILP0_9CLOT|nr:sensor histidine kinase [Clostridium oryzae]OPJ60951.1 hypothetical protein CLORY_24990 [Clostridium oryzae]